MHEANRTLLASAGPDDAEGGAESDFQIEDEGKLDFPTETGRIGYAVGDLPADGIQCGNQAGSVWKSE